MRFFLTILYNRLNVEKLKRKLIYRPKQVKIDIIRCQKDKEYSNLCGFGGKPIKDFEPYRIFKDYLKDQELAYKLFIKWLYKMFIYDEAWKIPKSKGGMKNGSLYLRVDKLFEEKGQSINSNSLLENKDLLEMAMMQKIQHYFDVFESIRTKGFNWSMYPIIAVKEDGLYYLINGHHRIAMLSVLGYDKVAILKISKFKAILKYLGFLKNKIL